MGGEACGPVAQRRRIGGMEQQTRNHVTAPVVAPTLAHTFDMLCRAVSGRRRTILSVLDNRVSWQAVQHWRKGRARAPQWALVAMLAALERKRGPIDHALNLARDLPQQKARDTARASSLPVK